MLGREPVGHAGKRDMPPWVVGRGIYHPTIPLLVTPISYYPSRSHPYSLDTPLTDVHAGQHCGVGLVVGTGRGPGLNEGGLPWVVDLPALPDPKGVTFGRRFPLETSALSGEKDTTIG